MKIYYKLTDQDGYTRRNRSGETKWYPGKTLETIGKGELCSYGWVHAYTHPLLAILLNPIHANIKNPRLWECECGPIMKSDRGLKVGTTKLTMLDEIVVPTITTEQKVKFAILCALEVYKDGKFKQWAEDCLSGKCRSHAAASAADAAAYAAACAANAAAHTASAAAHTASAAARAAAARAARATDAAAYATDAAHAAAYAAYAASAASAVNLDLIKLAKQAVN